MAKKRGSSRWWGLLLLLVAVGLYLIGAAHGAVAVIGLAVVVELTGWVKLMINPGTRS
ncbi:MAG: hypothetical protein AAF552_08435 [Pseudomonadota bacterium]